MIRSSCGCSPNSSCMHLEMLANHTDAVTQQRVGSMRGLRMTPSAWFMANKVNNRPRNLPMSHCVCMFSARNFLGSAQDSFLSRELLRLQLAEEKKNSKCV